MTPDGKHVYVTNLVSNSVSVIDTAGNMVVDTVQVASPIGVAVTPDGKHVYVADQNNNTVSVIDTTSNMVVGSPIPVGPTPARVAVTPDGKDVYVTNSGTNSVSVIDTASNMVVGTPILVGNGPVGIAVTPDGKRIYVANFLNGNVSAIDTASNTVVGTTPAGSLPGFVGIIPDIPFSALSAKLAIQFTPNHDLFELVSGFTLGSSSIGINPVIEPVTLQVGTFATTIPPGSFKGSGFGPFAFHGVINGAHLKVVITPTGAKRYALVAAAQNAGLTGTVNPVTVRVSIGVDSGTTSVKAIGLGGVALK